MLPEVSREADFILYGHGQAHAEPTRTLAIAGIRISVMLPTSMSIESFQACLDRQNRLCSVRSMLCGSLQSVRYRQSEGPDL